MMKKSAIWLCAMSSVFLVSCSVFEQVTGGAENDKSPPTTTSENTAKPKPTPPAKQPAPPVKPPAPKPQPPSTSTPETPDVFFKHWIKDSNNKATLQAWLNKKTAAPKDMDKFLTDKRYKDLRYEAYFDLVGSK